MGQFASKREPVMAIGLGRGSTPLRPHPDQSLLAGYAREQPSFAHGEVEPLLDFLVVESEFQAAPIAGCVFRARAEPLKGSSRAETTVFTRQGDLLGVEFGHHGAPRRQRGLESILLREVGAGRKQKARSSRRVMRELAGALVQINALQRLLPVCAWCKAVRNDKGYRDSVEDYICRLSGSDIVRALCPQCAQYLADRQPSDEEVSFAGERCARPGSTLLRLVGPGSRCQPSRGSRLSNCRQSVIAPATGGRRVAALVPHDRCRPTALRCLARTVSRTTRR